MTHARIAHSATLDATYYSDTRFGRGRRAHDQRRVKLRGSAKEYNGRQEQTHLRPKEATTLHGHLPILSPAVHVSFDGAHGTNSASNYIYAGPKTTISTSTTPTIHDNPAPFRV